ncbi:unnamed protein product [Larinioides sclopetarius]
MDFSGREEMLAGIDAANLVAPESGIIIPESGIIIPECGMAAPECDMGAPVQPQASSPLGAHVPFSRSSLPATCSWPGFYGFQLLFASQDKVNKHITWTYSQVDNKLYVRKDALCPFSFTTTTTVMSDVCLRAMAIFSSPEHTSEVVHRCVNHSQKELLQGILEAEHLIRSESPLARYETDASTRRHSVIMPFENPPVGQSFSTYIFKFACFSSCAGGPNRRPLTLIFTLEQGNKVLGRVALDLKICACPGRDKYIAEKEKLPQPTASAPPIGKKIKKDSSSISISRDYFENFPKKKRLEEEKPEKRQEYIIKVKDVECYNFLIAMKQLFQGHKRFGRLPPECRALLRIYKSSSDEDEKS